MVNASADGYPEANGAARADEDPLASAYLDAILSGDLDAIAAEDADAWRASMRLRAGAPDPPPAVAVPRGAARRRRTAQLAGRGPRRNPPLPLRRPGRDPGGLLAHED